MMTQKQMANDSPRIPVGVRAVMDLAAERLQAHVYAITENDRIKGPAHADLERRARQSAIGADAARADALLELCAQNQCEAPENLRAAREAIGAYLLP